MIKSISFSNQEILESILKLYIKSDRFDLDPTFSKGVFYKNIPEPTFKSDLVPQREDVIPADCTALPFKNESLNSICWDPPFLVGIPNRSKDDPKSNLMKNRFGAFRTVEELFDFYKASIVEFSRVLKPYGWLIAKCQDMVSSGKQVWSHVHIYNMALESGFLVQDLFILIAKSRMSSGKWKNGQLHARKYNSYYYVFQKRAIPKRDLRYPGLADLYKCNPKEYKKYYDRLYYIDNISRKKLYSKEYREKFPEIKKLYYMENRSKIKILKQTKHKEHKTNWDKFLAIKDFDKCYRCGYNASQVAIDIHHKDDEIKDFTVARFKNKPYNDRNIEKLSKELEKCIALCANCHRELHAGLWEI